MDQEKVLSTVEELSFPCLSSTTCHQFSVDLCLRRFRQLLSYLDLVYKIRNCGKCSDPLLILTTNPIVIYTKAAVELGLDETFMMNDFPSLAIDFIPGIDKYRIDRFIFFLKTLNI